MCQTRSLSRRAISTGNPQVRPQDIHKLIHTCGYRTSDRYVQKIGSFCPQGSPQIEQRPLWRVFLTDTGQVSPRSRDLFRTFEPLAARRPALCLAVPGLGSPRARSHTREQSTKPRSSPQSAPLVVDRPLRGLSLAAFFVVALVRVAVNLVESRGLVRSATRSAKGWRRRTQAGDGRRSENPSVKKGEKRRRKEEF
jgi:hypothetical protein